MTIAPPKCFTKTVKDRCRVCYTCVRGCPAKAIRILDRQAEIVADRCIGCGNCVRVCGRGAKVVVNTVPDVETLLATGARVAALVAPSFPAEFFDIIDGNEAKVWVGMLRKLGFALVHEVGFGADLVAHRYRELLETRSPGQRYIATTCPAVVGYVERYWPDLIGQLAPLVSPMVATARVVRALHGPELRTVFIGPCLAKKVEASTEELAGEVDAVITFAELRSMFLAHGVTPELTSPTDFDPPHPGNGTLFPLNRGLFQTAGISEELDSTQAVAAHGGPASFVNAIEEFAGGNLDFGLLEVLCCNGCVAGPGMTSSEKSFARRARIAKYANESKRCHDGEEWQSHMRRFADLDLSRRFLPFDQRTALPSEDEIREILRSMGKQDQVDELDCKACGYSTCREHATAIYRGLAEAAMCLPYVIERFDNTVRQLCESNQRLESTQEQLMHSERLASMGQLAAGVAHELNNPLGVVLLYAHLLRDEVGEGSSMRKDLGLISDQATRCKRIVSDLLDFARENKLLVEQIRVEELVKRSLAGLPLPSNVEIAIILGDSHLECECDPAQMIQVLTNLYSNAFAAMPDGGKLTIATSVEGELLVISVHDTGTGILPENLKQIFQPFFTTKQIGKGTGLGLAVVYGIVKMHRGDISVESNSDPAHGPTWTRFKVSVPLAQAIGEGPRLASLAGPARSA
ncbi:MAG: [Fe-Fe] hydrogenase large subunit C-terminal domain-containing protein [Polyangia bacterium]